MKQTIKTIAPFDLRNQNQFFGGWPVLKEDENEFSIVVPFPVEGWEESAAVVVSQNNNGDITLEAHNTKNYSEHAIKQAMAVLSLDVDDSKWEAVGKKDSVILDLQKKYNFLRPILFHSPYEAAAGFIIGQRVSIKQRQAIQKKMSQEMGEEIKIGNESFFAFPSPQKLLKIESFSNLSSNKIERLRGVAEGALEGKLDRAKLLKMTREEAIESLESLNGIGPFYASGILYRGAGIVDEVTDDSLTKYAVTQAYKLESEPTQEKVLEIAKNWKPYSMWCEVLLHIWLRREVGLPKRVK